MRHLIKIIAVLALLFLPFVVQAGLVSPAGGAFIGNEGEGGAACSVSQKTGTDQTANRVSCSSVYPVYGQTFKACKSVTGGTITVTMNVGEKVGDGLAGGIVAISEDADLDGANVVCQSSAEAWTSTGEHEATLTNCDLTEDETYYVGLYCSNSGGTTNNGVKLLRNNSQPYEDGTFVYGTWDDKVLDTVYAADLYFEVNIP